jgi:RNA polymerase sigma factor (TIGR02999 family)
VTGADPGEVTALLLEWNEGKEDARERLVALVYPELRRLASRSLRSGRADQTLQPTALVHEAYQKLVDQRRVQWRNRAHFFAIASELMRRIVVGHARHRHAVRRGGNAERVPFSEELAGTALGPDVELIALDDALTELAVLDKELARVVELRFFGGLGVEEAAEVLGVSRSTVNRDWSMARAWLHRRLSSP